MILPVDKFLQQSTIEWGFHIPSKFGTDTTLQLWGGLLTTILPILIDTTPPIISSPGTHLITATDPTLRHITHTSKDPVGSGGAWWRRHNGGRAWPNLTIISAAIHTVAALATTTSNALSLPTLKRSNKLKWLHIRFVYTVTRKENIPPIWKITKSVCKWCVIYE